jgi:hypothetical protein
MAETKVVATTTTTTGGWRPTKQQQQYIIGGVIGVSLAAAVTWRIIQGTCSNLEGYHHIWCFGALTLVL